MEDICRLESYLKITNVPDFTDTQAPPSYPQAGPRFRITDHTSSSFRHTCEPDRNDVKNHCFPFHDCVVTKRKATLEDKQKWKAPWCYNVTLKKKAQPILNDTILKCIRRTQAGCEIRPYVSPQVGLQSTWLKADWFKRALQYRASYYFSELNLATELRETIWLPHLPRLAEVGKTALKSNRHTVAILHPNSHCGTALLVSRCV